ncbi:MAG: tRNA pseudouridine(55) synthase TruB [Anaerolineaceae bacterium]|nr:tRNA pseudouridine(55) synthase TruB [Anaerolineaceae bacterium]
MKDEDSRKLKSAISGILVVDKPTGMTSHDVVAAIRKGTGFRRIGHTGTLDPRASGVLVVLIGPAVRLSEYLICDKKGYEATIRFGAVSDTYDGDGNIIQTEREIPMDEEEILDAMEEFKGDIVQIPPAYSAIKIHGKKAYDMARKGEEVTLPGRNVTVYSFDFIEYAPPELTADIICSSGTYIRSIANDLGKKLGCGAYLSGLKRTMSGRFSLRDAVPLSVLQKSFEEGTWYQYLIPAADALTDCEEVLLDMKNETDILHGRRIPAEPGEHLSLGKAVSEQGELLALLEFMPETMEWKPKKVFYQ